MDASSVGRRSPFRRFAFDRAGHLRGWQLLGMSAGIALILTIGGLAAVVIAGRGSPEAIALWATIAFFAIKIPVLVLLWWLLGRSEHDGEDTRLTSSAARAALARLRSAAERAAGVPDAWDRLDALAAEAGYVAAHAPAELTHEANSVEANLRALRDQMRPISPR
jgi:hypothetical protein